MTDREPGSRPSDPYRREPPVIDLPKADFTSSSEGAAEPGPADESAPEVQTAIEPIAATGLDGHPAEASGVHTDTPAVLPTPDEVTPTDEATPASTASPTEDGPGSSTFGGSVPPISARQPPPEKRGMGGLIAASLASGVIGAAFAVGADTYWRQPPADYESRLAALETRPRPAAQASSVPQPANEALERRIGVLETQARSLSEGVNAARGAAEASQTQVAELANRPVPVSGAVPPPPPDPSLGQGLDRLRTRLDALEGRIEQAAPAAAIDELRASIQNAQNQAEERQRATTATLGAVQATATGLTQRLQTNTEAVAKISAEVAKLPPTLLQAGLRAIVAGQIGQYLRAGLPLGPGLTALERLGAAGPALDPLRTSSAQAAPSAAALAAEFKPLAEKITAEPEGPTGSITDRLLRVADKIVTVRAVGDGSGRDVPGLVQRIESALARGALSEAAAAWDSLPDAPKRISAEWGTRLKARIAADNAAQALGADSLAALDAPPTR